MKTQLIPLPILIGLLAWSPAFSADVPAPATSAAPVTASAPTAQVEIISFRLKPKINAARLAAVARQIEAELSRTPGLVGSQFLVEKTGDHLLILHWRSEADRLRSEANASESPVEAALGEIIIERTFAVRYLRPVDSGQTPPASQTDVPARR